MRRSWKRYIVPKTLYTAFFLYYQTIHSVILTTAAEKGYLENQSRSHGWKHDKVIHISFVFVVVVFRVMEKKKKKKRKKTKTYKNIQTRIKLPELPYRGNMVTTKTTAV